MNVLIISGIDLNHEFSAYVEWNDDALGLLDCLHGDWFFTDYRVNRVTPIMLPGNIRTRNGAQKWLVKYLARKGYIQETK